jgi:hypothetical protein
LRRVRAHGRHEATKVATFAVGLPPLSQRARILYGNDVFRLVAGWKGPND